MIRSEYSILYGAVAIIFLINGLQLPPEKLKQNLTNWRLHVIIQGSSFAIIPVFMLSELNSYWISIKANFCSWNRLT